MMLHKADQVNCVKDPVRVASLLLVRALCAQPTLGHVYLATLTTATLFCHCRSGCGEQFATAASTSDVSFKRFKTLLKTFLLR